MDGESGRGGNAFEFIVYHISEGPFFSLFLFHCFLFTEITIKNFKSDWPLVSQTCIILYVLKPAHFSRPDDGHKENNYPITIWISSGSDAGRDFCLLARSWNPSKHHRFQHYLDSWFLFCMWARGEGEVGVDEDVRWKTSERNSRRKANWITATSFRLAETKSLQDIHKNHYQSTCVVYSCTKRPKFLSKIQFLLIWFDGCKRECLFGWDLYGSLFSLSLSLAPTLGLCLHAYISPAMGLTVWAVVKAQRRITSIPVTVEINDSNLGTVEDWVLSFGGHFYL